MQMRFLAPGTTESSLLGLLGAAEDASDDESDDDPAYSDAGGGRDAAFGKLCGKMLATGLDRVDA